MATEQNGSRNVVVVTQEEKPSFLKDEIQLKKLQKLLNKEALDAVKVLLNVMETTKDEKLKAQCAKDILAFTVSVNEKVSTDQIQRLVAEYKIGNGPAGKLVPLEEDSKPKRPVVDFTTVREV